MSVVNRRLQALDDAVAHRRGAREVAFLRAERAEVLARLGQGERVREEIAHLRASELWERHPSLEPWLLLAEGLADFYVDLTSHARDKVRRALALARSTRSARVLPLAAAWMAHLDFHARDDASAVAHLLLALETAPAEHHSARTRLCLVMAGMLHYAGAEAQAQPWYGQARVHAQVDGDSAALSAIMYNMALLRVMGVRLSVAFGEQQDAAALRRALLGTESSMHLDRSVSTRVLSHHPPMQRAQLLVLYGQPAEALALYESHMAQAVAEGLTSCECVFLADQAWCLVELGRGDEALVRARAADTAFLTATEPEDLAIAHAMLARVYRRLGLTGVAAAQTCRAADCFRVYQQRAQALLLVIDQAGLKTALRTPPC